MIQLSCIEIIDIIGKNYSLVKYYAHAHILRRRITGIGQGNEAMLELGKVANVEIAKLCHAEELAFRIRNRRNKQLGLWLASALDLTEEALDYARAIVAFGIAEPDDEVLIRHAGGPVAARGPDPGSRPPL